MSENKIGFALVHEICPICGKPMNEQILMNSVLSKKYAKEIENVHGKAIGYSKTVCEDCSKYKDEAVMCIAIDEAKGYYKKDNGTYQVQICINGKRINIGTYKTEEEAANVYNNYKNKYIENHANFRTEN